MDSQPDPQPTDQILHSFGRGQIDGDSADSSAAGRSRRAGERRSPATTARTMPPPGLAEHPEYEILRELGRGGMGGVYLAQNKLMGRHEVLKVVDGRLFQRRGVLDRFLGEVRNSAKLHHPNVVTAYSALRIGEDTSTPE